MITIVAKCIIKKGKANEFKAIAEELVRESRKEEGCISYNLFEDINDEHILTYIEEWKNEEAIKYHNQTKHFTTIVPKLSEFQESPTEVNLYKGVY